MQLQLSPQVLVALLLAAIRAVAWLVVCPPFNGRGLPMAAKALFAVAVVIPMVPRLAPQTPALDSWSLVAGSVEQVIIGAGLGFLTAVLFAGVQAAGDLLDVFGGFALAFAFDPLSLSGSSSTFGRFYGIIATTLLFVTDGYQLVVRGFTLSYDAIPLNQSLSLAGLATILTDGLSKLFVAALEIAGPLVVVLFCADIGLGLLNRIAPALNPFSIGFPAKIALTVGMVGLAIGLLPAAAHSLIEDATDAVLKVLGR